MALFKCKMCGGDLEVNEGVTIMECEYCGTKQTVPTAMDENLQNLFNRANTLRIKSEFDKAEKLYEKILQADSTQPEAYWGLILCKYGIEYVDDPATFKKIPTCHRASYDSIIADDDYKSAIANADTSQRALYEQQAREIDRIQKEILALAQQEEAYDVFICYKETDNDGCRTQDSVIANDIYYQLTQEGFKVFYAAITLEGKLGSAYEPIIFAALNSAKVMLAIGTKPEFFNAVWVKNEWSRYLKIIKKDRSKLLIPCYRDMDAYELPEEFAHLQAQDMGKIGFINDVVRGIKKVAQADAPKPTVIKETVVAAGNANTAPLLKRAFMFLEDGEFNRADDFCEQVLNQDPECAEAYVGKLMAELRVQKREKLAECRESFKKNACYQKALRFGDDKLKAELSGYVETVAQRIENAQKEGIYQEAQEYYRKGSITGLEKAQRRFQTILDYKDSKELIEGIPARIQEIKNQKENVFKESVYSNAIAALNSSNVADIEWALGELQSILDYKDSKELIEGIPARIQDVTYLNALDDYKSYSVTRLQRAIGAFSSLGDYKDSAEHVQLCQNKLEQVQVELSEQIAEIDSALAEMDNKRKKVVKRNVTKIVFSGIGLYAYIIAFFIFIFTEEALVFLATIPLLPLSIVTLVKAVKTLKAGHPGRSELVEKKKKLTNKLNHTK